MRPVHILVPATAFVSVAAWLYWSDNAVPKAPPPLPKLPEATAPTRARPPVSYARLSEPQSETSPTDEAAKTFHAAQHSLIKGTPAENAATLAALKRKLESLPPSEAMSAIRRFLDSGKNASTGLGFTLGAGGTLAEAPSLRVFLLDELALLGKSSGEQASSLAAAKAALSTPTSPDEWAIAMRNVAWADRNSADYLNGKFQELVAQPDWSQAPTDGMLQAFDIPVYTHDVSAIPLLASFLPPAGSTYASPLSPYSRAAIVALDRMAQQAPLEVMNYLNANPAVLADAPMMRADYFTKGDLSNPAQRLAVETYFSRADVTGAAKAKTVAGLVCPGTFVSDNLLTTSAPPADPAASALALQQAATDWAARFPALAAQLKALLQESGTGQ